MKQWLHNFPLVMKTIALMLLMLTLSAHIQQAMIVKAEGSLPGYIDLSKHSFNDFYKSLDGEWLYFDEFLLFEVDIDNFVKQADEEVLNIVKIPNSFEKNSGDNERFGTYAVKVKIPDYFIGKTLAIYIEYQHSAYRLFAEGVEIASNGKVGMKPSTHSSERAPTIGYFVPFTDEFWLTMQVSNFEHIRGGFEQSIFIGEAGLVSKKFNTNIIWIFLCVGCIFIMGVFMTLFAFFRKQERPFLIFGLFCISFAIRAFFADPFLYMLTSYNIPYELGTRFEYIFTDITVIMVILLVSEWYLKGVSKLLFRCSTVPIFLMIVMTLFIDIHNMQKLFTWLVNLVVCLLVILITQMILRRQHYSLKDLPNIIGVAIVGTGLLNDFLYSRGYINTGSMALYAVSTFVTIQVIMLSKNFARSVGEKEKLNETLTKLNATLDEQVHKRTEELQLANALLAEQAHIDSLTGIYNRHRFNSYIEKAFLISSDTEMPISIIMIDIDEFKKYNDFYGHIKGDVLIQRIVSVMRNHLPEDSLLARYGGEEFIVVIPNIIEEEAYTIAEQIRIAVDHEKIPHRNRQYGAATISLGIASRDCVNSFVTEVELVDAADQALYCAKREGRNLTVKYSATGYLINKHLEL